MPGLEDLYREIILDHYRTPRNRGELPVPPARHAEGHNPLCGDEISVFLDVERRERRRRRERRQGHRPGLFDLAVVGVDDEPGDQGQDRAEVRALVRKFKGMMSIETDGDEPAADVPLGDLEALQGVVKFPVRIKCATLAWNTLTQALDAPADV